MIYRGTTKIRNLCVYVLSCCTRMRYRARHAQSPYPCRSDGQIEIIMTQHTAQPQTPRQPGRPAFDISAEQLEHLLELGFSATTTASLLGVSRSTVCRRMRDFGLSCSLKYCCISDESLDDIVRAICQEFPGCGVKMLQGHLVERGVVVQQRQVTEALRRTDPEGVLMRQRLGIRRRKYNVTFPLELWHIDGNHKLIT